MIQALQKERNLKIIYEKKEEEEEEERILLCNHCLMRGKEAHAFICYFCKKVHCLSCIILKKDACHFVFLKDMQREICKDCLRHLLSRDLGFERMTETLKIIKGVEIECYHKIEKRERKKSGT